MLGCDRDVTHKGQARHAVNSYLMPNMRQTIIAAG